VLSIKSECLDRIVPMGEGHLRKAVAQFVDHYHRERNHQGIGNQLLTPVSEPATRRDRRLDRVQTNDGISYGSTSTSLQRGQSASHVQELSC
jgi:hypothetical protein